VVEQCGDVDDQSDAAVGEDRRRREAADLPEDAVERFDDGLLRADELVDCESGAAPGV
jgi:hypothetical protein